MDSLPPTVVQAPEQPGGAPTAVKPIHSLVIDTGPLIKNDPTVDALRSRAEQLYTLPSIIAEIRDASTRARVETTLLPFVTLRSPKPDSVKLIQSFARKTGDLEVLSRPDIEALALAYELECERNHGDWRLRSTPGQKTLNGKPPRPDAQDKVDGFGDATETSSSNDPVSTGTSTGENTSGITIETTESNRMGEQAEATWQDNGAQELQPDTSDLDTLPLKSHGSAHESQTDIAEANTITGAEAREIRATLDDDDNGTSEDEGWITPSNLKKHQARDSTTSSTPSKQAVTLQAAILTSDYAMQNVAIRMNLNVVSPQLARISTLRTWVLRCHACFQVTKQMDKRFCPSCGQPTLLRAACTVNDRTGKVTVHLKKNFQWNNRGNIYSVPKPVHGSAHGRQPNSKAKNVGGQNGWGRSLIFAEDQKEFARASDEQRRQQKKDLMDDDFLPGILTGNRPNDRGRIKVGAGRNVNSRQKK